MTIVFRYRDLEMIIAGYIEDNEINKTRGTKGLSASVI